MSDDFVVIEKPSTSLSDVLTEAGLAPEAHDMPCCYLFTANALTNT